MRTVFFSTSKKLGILGGGQLGKMMLPIAQAWDIYTKVLDADIDAPCKNYCNEFVLGNLQDFDTVYQFGQDCDVITIEIEKVNVDALKKLKSEGKVVHPNPNSLEIIQDKGLQKMFYKTNQIPTSDFIIFDNKMAVLNAIENKLIKIPFVQKTRKDGYDGRGVCVVNTEGDLVNLLDGPCLVEDKVEISIELAIIAARNEQGEIVVYDPVSMEFHDGANMLDLLLYPAPIDQSITEKAQQIAKDLITQFDICGLLAVEFLIDKQNNIWVNEVAPRAHNSGHQTIESSYTSQYQQHVRAILNLPLGSTKTMMPSAMVNILGAEGHTGNVYYDGITECLHEEGVFIHIYGKKITKPFRKMGHATIVNQNLNEAKNKALWVRQILQAKSL